MQFRTTKHTTTKHTTTKPTIAETVTRTFSHVTSLRGRAAAGALGAATLGAMTFGSAATALADTTPQQATTTAAIATQPTGTTAGTTAGHQAPLNDLKDLKDLKDPQRGQDAVKDLAEQAKPGQTGKTFAGHQPGKGSQDKTGATARDVIKLAEKQVGITEGADGNTKFHRWYINSDHAKRTAERDGGKVGDYNGASWCDMFVTWVGDKAGARGMGGDAYTVSHAQWFKDHDRWGTKARPGAVVFFDFDGAKNIGSIEHVGLVVKDNGDGTVSTVEGNTADSVQKRDRDKSTIVGYGYPEYRK